MPFGAAWRLVRTPKAWTPPTLQSQRHKRGSIQQSPVYASVLHTGHSHPPATYSSPTTLAGHIVVLLCLCLFLCTFPFDSLGSRCAIGDSSLSPGGTDIQTRTRIPGSDQGTQAIPLQDRHLPAASLASAKVDSPVRLLPPAWRKHSCDPKASRRPIVG